LAGSQPRIPAILTADLPGGKRLALLDQEAGRAATGPLWLASPGIARIVRDKIISLSTTFYDLTAWVIMANNVHIVILPKGPVEKILQQIKGATARDANKILERTGEKFWATESYHHWIRSENELNRVVRYVERNPVKTGMVEAIEHYPWCSAKTTDGSLCYERLSNTFLNVASAIIGKLSL
jgi:putative transposase